MLVLIPISASLQEFEDDSLGEDELVEKFLELAESYFLENEIEVAISFYSQVLDIDPSNIDAQKGLAFVFNSIGGYEDAIR